MYMYSLSLSVLVFLLFSSTNLTELAKAARILATLNPNELEGDDLLKAARALAAATAALLNAAAPENIEVGFNWNYTQEEEKKILPYFSPHLEPPATVGNGW